MLNIDEAQKQLLLTYLPNAQQSIDCNDINQLLEDLDDKITEIGFDANYELNEIGLKLQLLHDQLYNQNEPSFAKGGTTVAKDDYFVMAYKLLSYLYGCLKAGENPLDSGYLDYDTKAFPVGEAYWQYLLCNLYQEGYLQGVSIVPILGKMEGSVKLQPNISITPKGIAYLHENSMMQKVKQALKDVKEIILEF